MDGIEIGKAIAAEVDRVYAENHTEKPRKHLGASVIGDECSRAVWYGFRWFKFERFGGRMLRLFQRGHAEETRIIEWLRSIGAIVYDKDPQTGKQWLTSLFGGHFGGSCDALLSNLERFHLPGWGVLECKTHNEKSFELVKKKGVASSKLTHYIQTQIYMNRFGCAWGLYCAVNKNTDEIYFEVILAKPEMAEAYLKRALDIITVAQPPRRISNNSSWWVCKLCDFHDICHHREKAAPLKNCRTCISSVPNTEDGTWLCTTWNATIPDNVAPVGCDEWKARA